MRNPVTVCLRAILALCAVLVPSGAGCVTIPEPKVVTKIVERKSDAPKSLLECMPEPAAEVWESQRDVGLLSRTAGAGRTGLPDPACESQEAAGDPVAAYLYGVPLIAAIYFRCRSSCRSTAAAASS